MGGEWMVLPLEDCMDAVIDYRGKTPKKKAHGVPLITAKVVKGGRIETPNEFIAFDDYEAWMRRGIPKAGDVVVTTEAPLGEVAQLGPERVALAQRLIALRGKTGVLDNGFLKFLMQSGDVQKQLRARASGTTVLGVKQSELRKVLLSLPPFCEQRVIAHILGTLDDKIELNRKMSETLEAMARTLFKSWFVDFDPVRAKTAGEKPVGLADDIAALFPDRLVDSDLGEIPEGWSVTTLGDAFDLNPKRTLAKGTIAPYLDMANTPTTGHVPDQIIQRAFSSGSRFINGDTLLARITPCLENGKAAFVDFLGDKAVGWGSTEFIVMRPKAKLPEYFGYLLARYEPFKTHAIASMSGTSGRQRVQPDSLATWELVLPSEAVAMAFGQFVEPMRALIAAASEEIRVVRSIRDLLLPRLISGKLRVSEAEEAIAEAMA